MWNEIKNVKNIINSSDIQEILDNQNELETLIKSQGETVTVLNAQILPSILYKNIKQEYAKIEFNFNNLNKTSFQSIYYVKANTIENYEPNRQAWQRWIDILNDMYLIATGEKNKWCKLLCNDGYPTIKGEKIIVRGNE